MRALKELIKWLLYRPSKIHFGVRSYMLRPYRVSGAENIYVGDRTTIQPDSYIQAITSYASKQYQPRIDIGNDVYIGGHAYLTAVDRIVIGDGCVLSEYVYITDEMHGISPHAGLIMHQPLHSKGPVILGSGCFVGFRAALMPGVTLGEHCVVGANSTVTRSFPAYSMLGGSPARLLKCFSHKENAWLLPEEIENEREAPIEALE